MRAGGWILAGIGVSALLACGEPQNESFPEGAVAVWDGGTLTAAELDDAMLKLSPAARPAAGEATDGWYRTFARQLVFDRLLRREGASGDRPESPEWTVRERNARRWAVYRAFLERLPPVELPTEQELRDEFDANEEAQFRPASRLVFHLFLRVGPERSSDQAKEELERIRQRVLNGESFSELASQLSESETRHREGEMGWLRADQLGSLSSMVFSLLPRTPSEPVMTPQGGHLFYVEETVEERRFEFDEVRPLAADRMMRDRLAARLEEEIDRLPSLPEPHFVVGSEELQTLLAGGQGDTLVLQAGSFSLNLAALRAFLRGAPGGTDPVTRAQEVLEQIEARERVYQYAESEGWLDEPEVAERIESEVATALGGFLLERKLIEHLADTQEEVRAYFDSRRNRFATPLRFELHELRLPLEPSTANAMMQQLEQAAGDIDRGSSTLDAVQQRLGGELLDLGWVTAAGLSRAVPAVAAQAATVQSGGCLPPFRRQQTLHLIQITDREEPVERPFAEVASEVERAYLQENREDLVRTVRDDLLASTGFRFVVDDVAAMLRVGALGNESDL